jgi:hypothetical protein
VKTWLRLVLVVLNVGGGFMGCVLAITSLGVHRPLYPDLSAPVGLMLNLFVLVTGLIFVVNPTRIVPVIVALLIQIPEIRTAAFGYQFEPGAAIQLVWADPRFFCFFNVGTRILCVIAPPPPHGYGINLVPINLLALVVFPLWRAHRNGIAIDERFSRVDGRHGYELNLSTRVDAANPIESRIRQLNLAIMRWLRRRSADSGCRIVITFVAEPSHEEEIIPPMLRLANQHRPERDIPIELILKTRDGQTYKQLTL